MPTRCLALALRGPNAHTLPGLGIKGPCSINGVSQSIDNTAKKLRADRDVDNSACPLNNVTLLDELVVTKDDDTDVVGLQVKSHTLESRAELNHLLCLDVLQAVDTGDTVTNAEDTSGLLQVGLGSGAQD